MVLVVIAEPANIVSEGLHQPIGKCKEMETIHTPAGSILQREKYLCANRYDEAYFDFHCVPNGIPKQQDDGFGVLLPLEFYPICGTDFKNRAEYITVIWSCCILFGVFFYQMAACSGPTPMDPIKIHRRVARSFPFSTDRNTVTVKTTPRPSYNSQSRESSIFEKDHLLKTVAQPRVEVLRSRTMEVQDEPVISLLKKVPSRRKPTPNEVPSSTRVLRTRSYQVS